MFVFPSDEENQTHASADGSVGQVEGREADFATAALLHVEIEKIHDRMAAGQQAVGEVSRNAAKDESKGDLAGEGMRVKMMTREEQGDERHQGDECEHAIVATEQTPSGAGVAPVDE